MIRKRSEAKRDELGADELEKECRKKRPDFKVVQGKAPNNWPFFSATWTANGKNRQLGIRVPPGRSLVEYKMILLRASHRDIMNEPS